MLGSAGQQRVLKGCAALTISVILVLWFKSAIVKVHVTRTTLVYYDKATTGERHLDFQTINSLSLAR